MASEAIRTLKWVMWMHVKMIEAIRTLKWVVWMHVKMINHMSKGVM